jgi:hypothetical protein
MKVPASVRRTLVEELWGRADDVDWPHLSPVQKSRYYEYWAKDERIGGVLTRFIPQSQVRNYLKNSLMGGYGRKRSADVSRPLKAFKVDEEAEVEATYNKPHGVLLTDGRMLAWGAAHSWKAIILAVHERTYQVEDAYGHGVALFGATGKYGDEKTREMVETAAERLEVGEVVWLEDT